MTQAFDGSELVRRQGLRAAARGAGATAAAGLAAGGMLLATARPAAATLPKSSQMDRIFITTAINGSSWHASWPAVDRRLGDASSMTKCRSGSGTFTELVSHVRDDIAHHRRVLANVYVKQCPSVQKTPISKWSTKVKDIVTSVEKQSGWQTYFGGVVLDEEPDGSYTLGSVKRLNSNLARWMTSHHTGGSSKTTWLYGQYYGSYTTIWDNYSHYRSVVIDPGLRPMPQLYNSHMDELVVGACQISQRSSQKFPYACYVIPTILGTPSEWQTVPPLTSSMQGKTIPAWGSKDWYSRFTL